MLQKFLLSLKKSLTNNLSTKILSAVFALILWMVVVNLEDPEQNRSFTVPVTVTNSSYLTENNQYFEIVGESTVTIRVSANRSILDKLSSADFTAYANVENMLDNNRIPIEVSVSRYSGAVSIVSKTSYLQVHVGDLMETELVVTAETEGDPAAGCVVGSITTDPEVVKVTGPDEIVNSIDKVVAKVDITGANKAVTSRSALVYFDADGQIVDTSKLTLDAYNAAVTVNIESTKTVPISVSTSGELADGFRLKGISTNPTVVEVRGPAASLNDLTVVVIPGTVVNLSELTGSLSTTVDITEYLPTGVTLFDTNQTNVSVNVDVAAVSSKTLTLSTDDVSLRNLPEGMKVGFGNATYSITVIAEQADLELLDETDVEAYVDCGDLSPDTKEVDVEIVLDSIYELTEPVSVKVHVTVDSTYKKPEPEEEKTPAEDKKPEKEEPEKKPSGDDTDKKPSGDDSDKNQNQGIDTDKKEDTSGSNNSSEKPAEGEAGKTEDTTEKVDGGTNG